MSYEDLSLDSELKEKIEKAQSLTEVVKILNEKGFEITEQQLQSALIAEGELYEDSLEAVAGGSKITWKGVLKFISDTLRNVPRTTGPRFHMR